MKPALLRLFFTVSVTQLAIFNVDAQALDLKETYANYQNKNLWEKLYLHTDKAFYLAGEIMWFKAYYVNAGGNTALDVSKVAYIELLDQKNNAVLQAKIALSKGSGNGSFYLPATLTNGNYKLRAYTNWMKNYGAETFFEKKISIINTLKSPEGDKAPLMTDLDVQFFPEGGNLIAGAENKVGFRIADKLGTGITTTGVILNNKNDTIARFRPLKFGLGNFLFTPAAGANYRAIIKHKGQNIVKNLPVAATQGAGMRVNEDAKGQVSIKVNTAGLSGRMFFVAYGNTGVTAAQNLTVNNNAVNFNIDVSRLPVGVVHFVAFNEAKQPVSERLYFNRPKTQLTISQTLSSATLSKKSRAAIEIKTTSGAGKLVNAGLSMAVYKIDSLQTPDNVSIENYLWLSSELTGNIESPGYYFNNTGAEVNTALDNLLLTQGWRKFDWAGARANNTPLIKYIPEYSGHIIYGKITTPDNKPVQNSIAYLGVPGKRAQMYTAISDAAGQLQFNTKDFYAPGEIIVQTNTDVDSTSKIEIASPFSEQYSTRSYPPYYISTIKKDILESYNVSTQIQNIYSASAIRQFYNAGIDSSAFFANWAKIYKLDDFTRFTTMEEVLREYVTEVNLSKSKNRFHLITLGDKGILGEDPLVLVDGIPVFNANRLMAIDPLKINKLDVVRSRYFYGASANEGIFSFTSYKGDLAGLELDPRAVVLDYEGLQLQRKFYSPVYDVPQTKNRIPDLRNVLYWNPVADTDAKGKNTVTFYTSDVAGKFVAVVQGITASGEPGSNTITFEVK